MSDSGADAPAAEAPTAEVRPSSLIGCADPKFRRERGGVDCGTDAPGAEAPTAEARPSSLIGCADPMFRRERGGVDCGAEAPGAEARPVSGVPTRRSRGNAATFDWSGDAHVANARLVSLSQTRSTFPRERGAFYPCIDAPAAEARPSSLSCADSTFPRERGDVWLGAPTRPVTKRGR